MNAFLPCVKWKTSPLFTSCLWHIPVCTELIISRMRWVFAVLHGLFVWSQRFVWCENKFVLKISQVFHIKAAWLTFTDSYFPICCIYAFVIWDWIDEFWREAVLSLWMDGEGFSNLFHFLPYVIILHYKSHVCKDSITYALTFFFSL